MENLAILVDNKNDSTEAQDLLFSMGYKWRGLGEISKSYFYPRMNKYFIFMNKNEMDLQMAGYFAGSSRSYAESRFKEITLPQLRDLIVLKRNSIDDATHKSEIGRKGYLASGGIEYIWSYGNSIWFKPKEMNFKSFNIKPIEKPMKEYLDKQQDGTYKLIKADGGCIDRDWIEIPEGSETFNYYDRKDNLFFLKGSGEDTMFSNDLNDWDWKHWGNIDFDGVVCLWSRHTHPEELPFIDDEPLKVIDSEYSKDGNSVTHTVSLNDQYAEIEKVRQTLNQRQEQYGSFEDVAMITEQMVDVMRKGYYENLAYNQKMALYMICSKMARIVNGNPNHKDSWHDIAGYATLIDNELVSEKDMPF